MLYLISFTVTFENSEFHRNAIDIHSKPLKQQESQITVRSDFPFSKSCLCELLVQNKIQHKILVHIFVRSIMRCDLCMITISFQKGVYTLPNMLKEIMVKLEFSLWDFTRFTFLVNQFLWRKLNIYEIFLLMQYSTRAMLLSFTSQGFVT